MTPVFKVDLSNHDWGRGSVDIAAMRRDGVDVVIHKATDGPRFYRDPYFAEAMRRARAAAMPVTGAYHVLWNGNVTAQVDWFIDTVVAAAPWAATEPYEWMWDCEPFGYNGATPTVATINAACDRLMQRLPNHRPLAYCPKWAYGSLAGLRCPVVASSYGNNPAVPYRQAYPGDGSGRWAAYGDAAAPVILQFGSNTIVGGQRTVDANAYRGTLDQLRALITGGDDDMAGELADWVVSHVPVPGGAPDQVMGMHAAVSGLVAAAAEERIRDATEATAVAGLRAAVDAMATVINGAGGSVDVAAITAAVDARTAEVKQLFEQRHAEEIAELRRIMAAEVAGMQAEMAALRPITTQAPSQG